MFPFSSDNAYDSVAYDPVKTMLSELEAEAEEPTNHHACSRALQLQFDTKIVFETTTIQFSLDCKRQSHKRNRYSASNSIGLIFTRSYHPTLLITTPTPLLVKTSLKTTPWVTTGIQQFQTFLKRILQPHLIGDVDVLVAKDTATIEEMITTISAKMKQTQTTNCTVSPLK